MEEDEGMMEVGFMFDAALPKSQRTVRIGHIEIGNLHYIDDYPGAVQSGHYLWPASFALAKYLVENWQNLPHDTVLELGAGCGLTGLAAASLEGCRYAVLTDHDPAVLELLETNIAEQLQASRTIAPVVSHQLSWGPVGEKERSQMSRTVERVCGRPATPALQANIDRFSLILGSDVIYASTVVRPLLETVEGFLAPSQAGRPALFVLCQSFALDLQTEEQLAQVSSSLGLECKVVQDTLPQPGGTRIQHFWRHGQAAFEATQAV